MAALRTAFAETFIEQRKPINQSSVGRFLALATVIAAKTLVDLTYHLSCELFDEDSPDCFVCGPVVFTTTTRFLRERQSEVDSYIRESYEAFAEGLLKRKPELTDAAVHTEAERFADTHAERIHGYYAANDWVATVCVGPSHPALSRDRAERTIDAALDILRLFAVFAPERIRRASNVSPSKTYELISVHPGSVSANLNVSGRNARAGKGWWEVLQADVPQHIWRRLEEAITPLCAGRIRDELDQRLVDALNWFGQATRETNRGAAVVKYAAALERLTVTGHIEGIERAVIRRTLILNQTRPDKSEEQIEHEIGRFYQCRSDLMHGSLSPFDPSVDNVLRLGWELARWSILEAAQLFQLVRESGHPTRKALGAAYQGGRVRDDGSLLSGECKEGMNRVLLAPDVAEAFRDSTSVNTALRQFLAEHGAPPAKTSG